jgi:tRNA nucleotidyltransferase (CCA-adding enzyme)
MHMMPPRPGQVPIVPAAGQTVPAASATVPAAGESLAVRLLAALDPARWPVPPADLPPGTAVVGGAVRDALLGRLAPRPDLDLVVADDALTLARTLARRRGGSVVVLDPERSIARLVVQGWTIDLARRMGPWPEGDLLRRDFSANAIALELPADDGPPILLDPAGGLADLAAGRLRALAEANLLEDPLRLLRGVRLAAELGFRIEPRSWCWIQHHHRQLGSVAAERVLAELERLAVAPAGGQGLAQVLDAELLAGWGLEGNAGQHELGATLAELGLERATARGLSAAEAATAVPLARLAVLLDPTLLERLRASRRLQQSCARLRHWWQRLAVLGGDPERLDEPERLLLQQQLEGELPAFALLAAPTWARQALERWRDPLDPLFHPRPPLDGGTLQRALGLAPGRQLGALLHHLCRERAFGRLPRQPAADDSETLTAAGHWLAAGADTRHG